MKDLKNIVKNLQHITQQDVSLVGGKGAALGEMSQINMPVPPGFVIMAPVFEKFLAETDLNAEIKSLMRKINYQDINSVKGASVKIRDLILKADFPVEVAEEVLKEFGKLKSKQVAVRSSATAEDSQIASWAGELETYLNVTKRNLLDSIKKCWYSLFTPRAIFYRYEKKLRRQKICVAVIVQKMIQAEVSGICFTAHPVTEDLDQMVIEAGYGLGEAIVGGKITPDTYIVQKLFTRSCQADKSYNLADFSQLEILDKNIAKQGIKIVRGRQYTKQVTVAPARQNQQKLSDRQIFSLAAVCCRIERHYNSPQDIEWAYAKGRFYITQSRPVTTL